MSALTSPKSQNAQLGSEVKIIVRLVLGTRIQNTGGGKGSESGFSTASLYANSVWCTYTWRIFLVSDEQRALIREIATADSLSESMEIFSLTQELLGGSKFIFAADKGTTPGLSVGNNFKNGSAIRSLFSTEKVFVLDKETLREMSLGSAKFKIDYSISLDTQALSYLEPYIGGNVNKLPNDFREIFQFISQDNVFVDPMPYIHENYYNLGSDKASDKIFNKLKAYEVLRNLDAEAVKNESVIKTFVSESDLIIKAQQQISRMFSTLNYIGFMKELEVSFNYQYAHLLKMISIQLDNPQRNRFSKVKEFLDFCHFEVSSIGFREVFIACEFFDKGQNLAFFSKIQKNKKDLFNIIKGMAWDLYHIRQMERLATIRPDERARYFFPSFLTCDKRLVEVLDLYPLKCLAYVDGKYEPMPFFDGDILEALARNDVEKDEICGQYFTESSANYRAGRREDARKNFSNLVGQLEEGLSKISNVSIQEKVGA